MAIKQALTVGVNKKLQLSQIKPEYFEELFTLGIVTELQQLQYFYERYDEVYDMHDSLDPIINTSYDPHPVTGDFLELFDLPDGRMICVYVYGHKYTQYQSLLDVYITIRNTDGTFPNRVNSGIFGLVNLNANYSLYYLDDSSSIQPFPVYISVLYDDETEQARLIVGGLDEYRSYYKAFDFRWLDVTKGYVNSEIDYSHEFYTLIKGSVKENVVDPWINSGYADIGGGMGELDLTSDDISLPDLPMSATSTGFIQLYNPTFKEVNELSDYMWGDGFLNNVLKLWNDPMDIILNLALFPLPVPSAGMQYVTAGNVVTTVQMHYPDNQFITLDCGTIKVDHFYNAYVDYEPYTTCEIFLPYIGFQSLSMDDIMGKTLNVVYRIDLITGVCCAYILCDGIVLYSFTGTCSSNIPVSGQSFQAMAQSLIDVATAGVVAGSKAKGNPGASMATSAASSALSVKAGVSRSGSVSANAGMLGPQKPYLIFTIPRTCLPKGQNKFLGYPAYVTYKLSELSGLTVVDEIFLENCSCTDEEKNEIIELLKGGVIL